MRGTLLFALFTSASLFAFCSGARVKCPDGHSSCPQGTTCCALSEQQYGCCPLPQAVCCSDHLHCCPHDTTCDLAQQTCQQSDGRTHPLLHKFPASSSRRQAQQEEQRRETADAEVVCPDKTSRCPAHYTCCPLNGRNRKEFWRSTVQQQSNSYGCCPAEHAVCCADHEHCCPQGTQCDTAEGKCIQQTRSRDSSSSSSSSSSVESSEAVVPTVKFAATPIQTNLHRATAKAHHMEPAVRVCGDWAVVRGGERRLSVCDADQKCCRHRGEDGTTKVTGCCPFAEGQCCAHSAHCCPSGFACAREQGRCISEQNSITLSTALFPTTKAEKKRFFVERKPVQCPDGTVCPSQSDMCCARTVGDSVTYDCCPFKGACCAGQKCCPGGFKCAEGQNECERMGIRERIAQLFLH